MVQKKLQKNLIFYWIVSLFVLSSLAFTSGQIISINPEIQYSKDWKQGMTQVIRVDTKEKYGKSIIEIKDSGHNLVDKGIMYNTNQTIFTYNYYVPINAKKDRLTINLTMYGNKTYNQLFQTNIIGINWFEKAWLFLSTHLDFLEKVQE